MRAFQGGSKRRAQAAALLVAVGAVNLPLHAAPKYWIGSSDWWDSAGAWSAAGQPMAGDDVNLTPADGLDRLVSYRNTLYPTATLNSLAVDSTGAGRITLDISGDWPLSVTREYIGFNGWGLVTQSAGTHTVGTATGSGLYLAYATGSRGTYNLGGGLLSTYRMTLGDADDARGTFFQNGGTANILTLLRLGNSTSSSYGSYSLSSGMLSVGGSEYIGLNGMGLFTQIGGSHTVAGSVYIGSNLGSSGTLDVTGGTLDTRFGTISIGPAGTGRLNIGGSATVMADLLSIGPAGTFYDPVDAGNNSTLYVNRISGGGDTIAIGGNLAFGIGTPSAPQWTLATGRTLNVTRDLRVGADAGHTLSVAGTLNVGGKLKVGAYPISYFSSHLKSTLSQSDGLVNVAGDLLIGDSQNEGSYYLQGGRAVVGGTCAVGSNERGSFVQDGGSADYNALIIGRGYFGDGTYTMNGGTLTVRTTEFNAPGEAFGRFIQTGGYHVTPVLDIQYRYQLDNGTLNVTSYELLSDYYGGTFTQNGGLHAVQEFRMGYGYGTSRYNLAGGTLSVATQEGWGGMDTFTFSQTGGVHIIQGAGNQGLLLGGYTMQGTCSYLLTSGQLSVPNGSEYVGYSRGRGPHTFAQSGGSNSTRMLYVGYAPSGYYSLSGATSTLAVTQKEYIGYGTQAQSNFVQTGGLHSVGQELAVGYASGGSGTLDVSGGTLDVGTGTISIGSAGVGRFNLGGSALVIADTLSIGPNGTFSDPVDVSNTSTLRINHWLGGGNTLDVGGNLQVGYGGGSGVGTLDLSAGRTVNVGQNLDIGRFAAGGLSMNGGVLSVSGSMTLSYPWDGQGSLTINSGEIHVARDFLMRRNSDQPNLVVEMNGGTFTVDGTEYLAEIKPAMFRQNGGLHTVSRLDVGRLMGSECTYTLTGGTLAVATWERIGGGDSIGTFIQSGGYHTAANQEMATLGRYFLQDGTLAVGNQYLGRYYYGTMIHTGGTNAVTNLWVGGSDSYESTGAYDLSGTGSLLVSGNERIGSRCGSRFIQTGGTHVVSGSDTEGFRLGFACSLPSSYTLNSGSLAVPNNAEYIGCEYQESVILHSFLQGGGSNSASALYVGWAGGGRYELSGSAQLNITGEESIGYAAGAHGVFVQSGGTHTVGGSLSVAPQWHSSGTLNISGGVLAVAGELSVGKGGTASFVMANADVQAGSMWIGCPDGATSVDIQSGSLRVQGDINFIGSYSYPTISLRGGTVAVNGTEWLAYIGPGAFIQSGGVHRAANMYVGKNMGAIATYSLNDGTLAVAGLESVGYGDAVGTVLQSGGYHSAGTLELAAAGTYVLSGGVLDVRDEYVGHHYAGGFNQSAGKHVVQNLSVGYGPGSSPSAGHYTLSGTGTLAVGLSERIGCWMGAHFMQDGGTHTVAGNGADGLLLGFDCAQPSDFSLSGGSLSVPNGSEYIGYGSQPPDHLHAHLFSHTGGVNSTNALYIAWQGAGRYDLGDGAQLAVATSEYIGCAINSSGTFIQTGGTHTVGQNFVIGRDAGSSGKVDVPKGAECISAGQDPPIFTQTAGTNTAEDLYVGWQGEGSYILSEGTLVAGNEYLGYAAGAHGVFTHGGGSNSANTLYVGWQGLGQYNLSGTGALNVAQNEYIGNAAGSAGTLLQSAGRHSVGQNLIVASEAGSSGTLGVTGGTLTVATGTLSIGPAGAGRFDLGGSATVVADLLSFGPGATFSSPADSSNTSRLFVNQFSGFGSDRTFGGNLRLGQADGTLQSSLTLATGMALTVGRELNLGDTAPATLSITGGVLTVGGRFQVGYGSDGRLRLSGGSLVTGGDLTVGNYLSGCGFQLENGYAQVGGNFWQIGSAHNPPVCELQGGTLDVKGTSIIGTAQMATFTQSGGVHLASMMYVGSGMGGDGTYKLSAGTLAISGPEILSGGDSNGSFSQTGGYNTAGTLQLRYGQYELTSGTLSIPGQVQLSCAYDAQFVHSGGLHSAGTLTIGGGSFTRGTYSLSGMGTLVVAGNETMSSTFGDRFIQSGGSHTILAPAGGGLFVQGRLDCTYLLSGGSLSVPDGGEYISAGRDHGPLFDHQGGTNTTRELHVGRGGHGRYGLGGTGTLNVTANEYIGSLADGVGTFTQSGGTHTVGGTLTLAQDAGSVGEFDLSGGKLDVGTIRCGPGTATFRFTGGTLSVGTWEGSAGGTGTLLQEGAASVLLVAGRDTTIGGAYRLTNGRATIAAGRRLSAAGVAVGDGTLAPVVDLAGTLSSSTLLISSGTFNANSNLGTGVSLDLEGGTFNANVTQDLLAPIISPSARMIVNANGVELHIYDSTASGASVSGATIASVWSLARSGYNGAGGAWSGTGISTTAISDPAINGLGLKLATGINGAQYLTVREMILGDVNGDNKVTIGDVMVALNSANYQQDGTWLNGDVNYDGKVTIGDVMLMLNSTRYQQDYNPANAPAQIAALESAGLGGLVEHAVPEPATLGLLAVGAMSLLGRRRRA